MIEINNKIDRVIEIFSTYNNFKLLGALSYNLFENQNNPEDDGKSELALEYATSFSMAINDNPETIPSNEVLNEIRDLLYDIRSLYNTYIMTESAEDKFSEIESLIRFKTIIHSLYIRGSGYQKHILKVFEELFQGHDDLLVKHYGFNSKDIIDTFLQLENSWYCRTVLPSGLPHFKSFERFGEWQREKGIDSFDPADNQPIIDFLNDNPDFVKTDNKPSGFGIDDVNMFDELYKVRFRKEIHRKVVESVSLEFGENKDFLNPKFKGLPLNTSLAYTNPIIKHDNDYYLFAFSILIRNLFDITENLILKADKDYYNTKYLGNKYSKSRDNYLENKTFELFSSFLPDSKAYQNLKYKFKEADGSITETELDLLIETEKANYIIEIKAGGLSAQAKRGALKSLTSKIEETAGYGAYQSHRALQHIKNEESPIFVDDKNEIIIDKSKKCFRITITLEQLSNYLANIHELRILGAVENEIEMAWTCSLFDLMIFSEIIENEDDFIAYLEKRIPLYNDTRVDVDDEIDFLGYYLEKGELIDKKAIKGTTSFRFHKMSSAINDYFENGGTKPKKKR